MTMYVNDPKGITARIGDRILILGCSGSGKSTFARKLHERTGLPLIHLDNIWWKADRTHITREAFDRELDMLLSDRRWILDGDYSRTYEVRLRAADTVFFLDVKEEECMRGITERTGGERPDIPWTEPFPDPALITLIRRYRNENRPVLLELFRKYPEKQVIVFRTRCEADTWLNDTFPSFPERSV